MLHPATARSESPKHWFLVGRGSHYEDYGMSEKLFRPGDKAPRSGQYRNTTTGYEVTVTQGEPLPPTPGSGQQYRLADPTRHKRR